ncbi:YkyA family protein [Jeotgalibacillus sp. S-D1]|uniref:YkyA family protein n=1 Tax=Jeotgalibacillus sp. S-D1 TaxID=2552189 RepID=UPI001404D6F0|nr:YkyA family protein [Jeotgalibacillus sp. S-D1]
MKKSILAGTFLSSILLAGCVFGSSPEEDISGILDSTVEKEQGFVDSQEPIKKLEQEEQELFDKIMSLNMEEFKEVEKQADQALNNLEKREEQLTTEKESIEEAKEEFKGINDRAEDIEDEKLRAHVENMIEVMDKRYKLHGELAAQYTEALEYDRELYTMLKDKELKLEDLEAQIEKVNAQYNLITESNEEFNSITDEYNSLKNEYYDLAKLNEEE